VTRGGGKPRGGGPKGRSAKAPPKPKSHRASPAAKGGPRRGSTREAGAAGARARAPAAEPGDLSPSTFNTWGHELVEWITRYLERVEEYPVLSPARPGDTRAALPEAPPLHGESFARMLADVERVIVPGLTHWNHPGFFAYFATTGSVPGILGEFLTAAFNVNAMLWRTSPSATELEELALRWLRRMAGLGADADWFGIITDSASVSTMLALAAAREAAGYDIRLRGMAGRGDLPALRVYCSEQAHSSVDKGAMTLGLGLDNVVHIGTDNAFRMRPDLLARAIAADRAQGHRPLAVVATVGTTSSTSIDPVPAIAELCRAEQIWLHVDAAYGGVAAIVPALRHVLDGVDRADSVVLNPHKWLFTPIDCSALFTRQPDALRRAFSLVPEYLTSAGEGGPEVVNAMDYGVQLGHRFRALKLWMVIRAFGTSGLAERIAHHVAMARAFADWVRADAAWEVVAPVPFSTVCFRWAPAGSSEAERDARNADLLERVNASGRVFLSHTKLGGRYVLRLAIGNLRTQRRHVAEAWALLRAAAETPSVRPASSRPARAPRRVPSRGDAG
jgi:aromatic-L-amino-acid/L-tryptophan decarboxylase